MGSRLDKEGGEYWYHLFIEFPFFIAAFWGCIAISYIVHAICAGIMGTWYFNTSRGKTVTDSVVRVCTTSLGSISFAAFIVAVIRPSKPWRGRTSRKHAK